MSDKTVSVCMITYNHEAFISEAIEGVLMQQTSFPIELVLGEDCSTDRTREICMEYRQKHPGKIRLLLNEKNLGMMPNFIQTLKACTGKYIALCEGDDYWTDPYKLQKQANFLQINHKYSFCFSNIVHVNEQDEILNENWPNRNSPFSISKRMLGEEYLVPTLTLMFKNRLINNQLKSNLLLQSPIGDYIIESLLLLQGKGYFFPEPMGAYRHHSSGVFSAQDFSKKIKAGIQARDILKKYFLANFKLSAYLILLKNTIKFKQRYKQ